jgi:predicted amidohydrolase
MRTGYYQFTPEFKKPKINLEKISENIYREDFDLMVIPEMASTGYLFSERDEITEVAETLDGSPFLAGLQKIAKEKGSYIVSGFCEKEGDKLYNSSALLYPNGRRELYRKIHLFIDEQDFYERGNIPFQVHEIKGKFGIVKTGMMICFDWVFPEAARTLALLGAQIICHPANLVMPYCQRVMYARAVENHVFIVTANRTGTEQNAKEKLTFSGKSVILDPKGKYLTNAEKVYDENITMEETQIEECRIVNINPEEANDKFINRVNNVITDRRPEFYKTI